MTRPGIALGRPRHDPAIRLGIEEIVVGRVGLQYDTHIRNLLVELRQQGISQRVASVDTDRTVSRLRGEACVSISIIASLSTRSDWLDPIEQLASGFGQRDAAATAQEQYDAQP